MGETLLKRRLALVACLALAACTHTGPDPGAAWVLSGAPPADLPEIAWLPDGSGVLVDGRWILLPRDARFLPLPYHAPRHRRALDASGRWIALWGRDHQGHPVFQVGPVEGPLGPEIPLPLWLEGLPADASGEDLGHAITWLSPSLLYLTQWWTGPEPDQFAQACRLFNLRTGEWIWVRECLHADFTRVQKIDTGGHDWKVLYSSTRQGLPGVRMTRWNGELLPLPPGTPLFDLVPLGWLEVHFMRFGAEALIATPCDLDRAGCQAHRDAPWRIYGWPIHGGALTLLHQGLPPLSTPSPSRGHLAWPLPGQVCVSPSLDASAPAECFQVPDPPQGER